LRRGFEIRGAGERWRWLTFSGRDIPTSAAAAEAAWDDSGGGGGDNVTSDAEGERSGVEYTRATSDAKHLQVVESNQM
jgi:hypothetical protein